MNLETNQLGWVWMIFFSELIILTTKMSKTINKLRKTFLVKFSFYRVTEIKGLEDSQFSALIGFHFPGDNYFYFLTFPIFRTLIFFVLKSVLPSNRV